MLKTIGIIPSRFNSSRFPGKPLEKIAGKTLIERVYERACQSKQLQRVLVATDDSRIFDFVQAFGGEVVMTSADLETGSDRVWQACQNQDYEIIVNIQGDEPLIEEKWLDQAILSLKQNYDEVEMVTLATDILSYEMESKDCVKLVTDSNDNAIYFSRHPIPFSRCSFTPNSGLGLKHMGIYVYKKSFLQKYCQSPVTDIELCESLEQLRALYLGAKIKVVKVNGDSVGVDRPEDIQKVEEILQKKGLA